jgi:hypothetical protein
MDLFRALLRDGFSISLPINIVPSAGTLAFVSNSSIKITSFFFMGDWEAWVGLGSIAGYQQVWGYSHIPASCA